MDSTTKKDAKKSKAKSRRSSPKEAKLVQENKELKRERDESLEREAATSDILRLIANAPANLQSVMDAIAENAARLCDANDVLVRRTDDKTYQTVSHFGSIPTWSEGKSSPSTTQRYPAERFTTAGQSMSLTCMRLLTSFQAPSSMRFHQA